MTWINKFYILRYFHTISIEYRLKHILLHFYHLTIYLLNSTISSELLFVICWHIVVREKKNAAFPKRACICIDDISIEISMNVFPMQWQYKKSLLCLEPLQKFFRADARTWIHRQFHFADLLVDFLHEMNHKIDQFVLVHLFRMEICDQKADVIAFDWFAA